MTHLIGKGFNSVDPEWQCRLPLEETACPAIASRLPDEAEDLLSDGADQ